jgi:hypothetical protein
LGSYILPRDLTLATIVTIALIERIEAGKGTAKAQDGLLLLDKLLRFYERCFSGELCPVSGVVGVSSTIESIVVKRVKLAKQDKPRVVLGIRKVRREHLGDLLGGFHHRFADIFLTHNAHFSLSLKA